MLAERGRRGWGSALRRYRAEAQPPAGSPIAHEGRRRVGSQLRSRSPVRARPRANDVPAGPAAIAGGGKTPHSARHGANARDEVRARGGRHFGRAGQPRRARTAKFPRREPAPKVPPATRVGGARRQGIAVARGIAADALVAVASADATIASFEAKYPFLFWRPDSSDRGEGWTHRWSDTPCNPEISLPPLRARGGRRRVPRSDFPWRAAYAALLRKPSAGT
jgi:hypothetical protein